MILGCLQFNTFVVEDSTVCFGFFFIQTHYTLKRYIRKIMNVLHLLRVTRQKVKVDLLAECQNQKRQDERKSKKEHLTFDPSYFRAATTTYGGLSTSARTALWKPIGHRTPDDVRILTVRFRLAIFSNMDKVYYILQNDIFERQLNIL